MKKYILFGIVVLLGIFGLTMFQKSSQPPSTTPNKTEDQPLSTISDQTTQSTPSSIIIDVNDAQKAIIKTSKGEITLTLYPNDASNTVVNFIAKAKSGFYKSLTFHRVEDWVIQGGDPLGDGTGGGEMPTELNNKPFFAGSLGVARGEDIKISNDAQFFITKKDSAFLNSQYTNFGIVTKGMDIVEKIEVGDKILQISTE
ncbi:MAG: peptidylprolyl isomerase [Patescibacteria group bacterium]